MGSRLSSPAAGDRRRLVSLIPRGQIGRGRILSKEMLAVAGLGPDPDGRLFTEEEVASDCICRLVHRALKHYNDNNQGAEFRYPPESTTEMKAACIGFREHFIWYHLRFSARRLRDDQEMHLFFAELCYDLDSTEMAVKTCTILEEPLCRFRSSCAFCPEESKIMHPSETEFECGKEGQKTEFFRTTQMLTRPFDDEDLDLDLTDDASLNHSYSVNHVSQLWDNYVSLLV